MKGFFEMIKIFCLYNLENNFSYWNYDSRLLLLAFAYLSLRLNPLNTLEG
jgi:hypothetical protein